MFDPYRKWLGIQPKDQPPNHYRLLGVDLFEDDLDVIEGAADRQMAFVRQYQSGEHAGDAARILNELAAARLCLLKPTTKAAYDKKLRQAEAASAPNAESAFADLPFTDADLPSVRSPRKKSVSKSKPQGPSSQLLIAGGIGAVVCLILVIFLMSGRRDRLVEKTAEPKPASSGKPITPDQVPATPDSTAKVEPSPSHPYAWVPTALVTDPIDEPRDLLKLVDLNRDVNAGKWDQTKTALIGDRHSRLYLPTRLPEDYQLKLTVRRMEGIDTLKIGFMMGGRQGMLALDGWSSTQSGLYLDGREPNSNCTTRPGKLFQDQSASTIVLTIHPRHVHVSFDGKPIVDMFGNPERLDLYQNAVMPSRESPFLETADAKYVFESITLVPIKPEPSAVRPARLDREIDILPLVDLDTDMQQGIWSIQKNTLYSPEKNGRLYLPTVVPEEYTLSATVEMNSDVRGIFAFVVGLVADQTNFRFVAADGDTGLDMVDGQRWWFNNTRIRGPILKAGVPAKLAMTVTTGGVRVDVDNRTIIDWRGDVRRLATAGDAQNKDARRLVLEASHHCKIRDLKLGPPVGPLNYSIHPPVPAGKSIDLLSAIDHQRDAFWGTWQRDGNALRCLGDDPATKLVIPYDVPGDFKLSMRVTRVEGGKSNDEAMFLGFPFESSRAAIVIDGRASKMTGLYLDGVDIDQNPFTHRVGPVLPAGTPRDVVLTVQNHRLQLRINDAPILDWNGNSKRCSVPSELVTPGRWLSLASYQQGFRFEKLDLELLGMPTERPAAKLSADGKLLPILDLDRDVRRGEWILDKEGLTCPTTPGCRLRIPVSPPAQYVFSAQVERKQGDNDLYFGLRVGQYAAGFGIDGMNGREAGVDSLDGMRYIAGMNPTNRKYAAALLPKDQSVLVRCYVLPDTIVVTCGDKMVGRWHGDPRRLATIPDFNPWNYTEEDRTHLWVGSWGTQFLFRDLELKPLSDTEAAELLKSFSGVFPLSSQSGVPLAPFNGNPANFADTPPVIPAKPATEEKSWLLNRKADAPALILVHGSHITEREAAMEACRQSRLPFEIIDDFPAPGFDYQKYSMIVVGTNIMNYWGSPERTKPEAFQSLETFVRGGGHLIVFNVFNGANMHHLKQFGIQTSFNHSNSFQVVPGVTEIVFDGAESLIPTDPYLKQAGNFDVDKSHVVLLQRGTGSLEGGPAVSTVRHGSGRVTYSSLEPSYGFPRGFWLVHGLIRWAARGAPVTRDDLAAAKPIDKKGKPGAARKLTILEARYGTPDKWVDVKPLLSSVKIPIVVVVADPALVGGVLNPDMPRNLYLRYRLDGIEEFQKIDEFSMLNLDLRPAPAAQPSQDFKLIEARWGVGIYHPTTWVDVTTQLRPFVKNNLLNAPRGEFDSILTGGAVKDPEPRFWKSLVIHYQYKGRDLIAVFPRGTPILLGDIPQGFDG